MADRLALPAPPSRRIVTGLSEDGRSAILL